MLYIKASSLLLAGLICGSASAQPSRPAHYSDATWDENFAVRRNGQHPNEAVHQAYPFRPRESYLVPNLPWANPYPARPAPYQVDPYRPREPVHISEFPWARLHPSGPAYPVDPYRSREPIPYSKYPSVKPFPHPSHPTTRTLAHFSNATWVENIAVRSNGQLLVTTFLPEASVYQIDPFRSRDPVLVSTFPTEKGCAGIAELAHDEFFVIGSTASLPRSKTPNNNAVYKIDMAAFDAGRAHVTKVVELTNALAPNGMTALDKRAGTLLIGDAFQGCVYLVDTVAGTYRKVQDDNTMKATIPGPVTGGINGLHVLDGKLYFTNSNHGTLYKVAIHKDGTAAGPYEVVSDRHTLLDDFTVTKKGDAFIATNSGNTIEFVKADGFASLFAGNANSVLFSGTTAMQFGRTKSDGGVLYVTTDGGLASGKNISGGKVVAVDARRSRQ
ncbi:hypothetical protein BDK51DRAFT_20226 [Blyttiomyces helicus]|uniref:SMP-30/Gluconolactonase/LRE-like region domain-containing protein n=1 Tax=Blyttiomyces helicus TaxID=388810 RepID=A0A4P9W6G8_9FUNG|nr:hypothetical protein BDK51DRAFT_20226 [Blyttiomyces helicus]|eukprot:RKO86528.1 hypothetical protein BDK51DRAFT_20226 [Blyttiomyces helicus]